MGMRRESCSTKYLANLGVTINIPHDKSVINTQGLLIHSAIIRPDNVEILEARRRGISVLSRKDALPLILGTRRVFSVCGAHGKSTTTAMLSAILNDFSAIIGAQSKEFGSNVRTEGDFDNVVFEADESDGSFLNSNPHCAIVTNAEPEHMEHYNYDLNAFHAAYVAFLRRAKIRVFNAEDAFLATLDSRILDSQDLDSAFLGETFAAQASPKPQTTRLYPSRDIKNLRYFLKNGEPFCAFGLENEGRFIGDFEVWGFGAHTATNAALAVLAALNEKDTVTIAANLKNYRGIKKRFDIICSDKCVIIDDYGHHPTEIRSTLDSIREYSRLKKIDKISVIWQPHKYSRTIHNIQGFANCFGAVDKLVILPVWRACEEPVPIDFEGYFGRYLPVFADEIRRSGESIEVIKDNRVLEVLDSGVIVGFGAGDITYQMRGCV